MRVICPGCGAEYEIDDDLIPDEGREVQCSACDHGWFQRPPPLDSALADELGTDPELWMATPPPGEGALAGAPEMPAEAPADPPATPRPPIDPTVREILTAEAEREIRARRAAPRLETQEELGLTEAASPRRPEPGAPDPRGATAPPARPATTAPPDEGQDGNAQSGSLHGQARPESAALGRRQADLVLAGGAAAGAVAGAGPDGGGSGQTPEAPVPGAPVPGKPALSSTDPSAAPHPVAAASGSQKPAAPAPSAPTPVATPAGAASRTGARGRFPDIEAVNSALDPDRAPAPGVEADADAAPRRGGFALGFASVLALALLLWLLYRNAHSLGDAYPWAAGPLDGYAAGVDSLWLWLGSARAALGV